MTEKLRRIEVSREARRLLRATRAPANRQDDSPALHLYYPLCRVLDRTIRVKRDLKMAFDRIRRDAENWTRLIKGLKKLHRLYRRH